MMEVSVSEAQAKLTELVRAAEAGEDVVLTRHGKPVVRLVAEATELSKDERMALLDSFTKVDSAWQGQPHSSDHDFLYDERGLPK